MKNSILFLVTLLTISTIQAQKKVKGNGNVTTITRTTSEYDGIKCAGSFDFILVAGTEGTISIEGEDNLLDYIITEVKGNDLIVKVADNVQLRSSTNKTIRITIPFKDIDGVSLAGSGVLHTRDKISTTKFKSSLAGSGDMKLNVDATEIKVSLAGSGNMTLEGKTNMLEADIAGSGNYRGFNLTAHNADVSISGSGDVEIVCNGDLKGRVAGSGSITYKGNPKNEDTKVAGSGRIGN